MGSATRTVLRGIRRMVPARSTGTPIKTAVMPTVVARALTSWNEPIRYRPRYRLKSLPNENCSTTATAHSVIMDGHETYRNANSYRNTAAKLSDTDQAIASKRNWPPTVRRTAEARALKVLSSVLLFTAVTPHLAGSRRIWKG